MPGAGEQVFAFQHQQLPFGEQRFVSIKLFQIAAACHIAVLLEVVCIAGSQSSSSAAGRRRLPVLPAMPAGMEHLRQRSLRIHQHDHPGVRQQLANAGGRVGMKEIEGCDVPSPLAVPGFVVVGGIPTWWLFGMQAEVVHLFAGRQVYLRVLLQQFLQAGGTAFLGAKAEEMWQAQAPPGPTELFGGA